MSTSLFLPCSALKEKNQKKVRAKNAVPEHARFDFLRSPHKKLMRCIRLRILFLVLFCTQSDVSLFMFYFTILPHAPKCLRYQHRDLCPLLLLPVVCERGTNWKPLISRWGEPSNSSSSPILWEIKFARENPKSPPRLITVGAAEPRSDKPILMTRGATIGDRENAHTRIHKPRFQRDSLDTKSLSINTKPVTGAAEGRAAFIPHSRASIREMSFFGDESVRAIQPARCSKEPPGIIDR